MYNIKYVEGLNFLLIFICFLNCYGLLLLLSWASDTSKLVYWSSFNKYACVLLVWREKLLSIFQKVWEIELSLMGKKN
jgi:hypothetical protein